MANLLDSVLVAGPKLTSLGSSGGLYRHAKKVLLHPDSQTALAATEQEKPDLVIAEVSFVAPALELLERLRQSLPTCRVVFVFEDPQVEQAVGLLAAGAGDCVRAPLAAADLEQIVASFACQADLSESPARPHVPLRRCGLFFHEHCPPQVGFVGTSPAAARAMETIRIVAESRCNPILITGPTGTGKELAAQAVHHWRCGEARFVGVNCAALTANLLESELFGHVKGAFTGADRDKTGLIEAAEGGSIFLDEISEMSPDLQAKLLRVLQEKTFRKVGSTDERPCNVTIIASSNRNLMDEVKRGVFRQDLYYRLAVFPVALPALSDPERRGDIELLANYFIATSKISSYRGCVKLSPAALARLQSHNWPGNVRELKNVIDRALILNRSDEIPASNIIIDRDEEAAPAPFVTGASSEPYPSRAEESSSACGSAPAARPSAGNARCSAPVEDFSLESAERELIIRALNESNWQRTKAATLLGITRATLHAKIKRYEIQRT